MEDSAKNSDRNDGASAVEEEDDHSNFQEAIDANMEYDDHDADIEEEPNDDGVEDIDNVEDEDNSYGANDDDIVTHEVAAPDADDDEDEDEFMSVKSVTTDADLASIKTDSTPDATGEMKTKAHHKNFTRVGGTKTKRGGRTPSVSGLTIPFRTIKKAMKLDPDIPIVQNEAAIMTTIAVEMFLKRLAKESFRNAKNRGRNTVRYEDVAEARTRNPALAFLEPLLP